MIGKQKRKNTRSFWHKIRFKYKLSFFNENSLEEVWSFRLSKLSAFVVLFLFAFFLVSVTALIIILTPIRNYLPGYLDVEIRKEIMQNALKADSLAHMISIQSLYLDNVADILSGNISLDSIKQIDSIASVDSYYEIPIGKSEAAFVEQFAEEEKYNLTVLSTNEMPTDGIFLYKPLTGVISNSYDARRHHYGIDIVAAPKSSVMATMDGVVIFTGYDTEFGNVIQIQHRNGFVSIYKHNDSLLKKIGEDVKAGEAIALLGNTGNASTGPHLHFELWYKGKSVNPEDYIAF